MVVGETLLEMNLSCSIFYTAAVAQNRILFALCTAIKLF